MWKSRRKRFLQCWIEVNRSKNEREEVKGIGFCCGCLFDNVWNDEDEDGYENDSIWVNGRKGESLNTLISLIVFPFFFSISHLSMTMDYSLIPPITPPLLWSKQTLQIPNTINKSMPQSTVATIN